MRHGWAGLNLGVTEPVPAFQKPTIELIRVRYGETDMMGHAYYANYYYWFEQARGAYCRARGFTYLQMEELGFKLPVVEAHANYKAEVLYDDVIEVKVWISEMKRASMRFEYEIYNRTRQILATTGYTWHVLIGSARKAISFPPEVKDWLLREPLVLSTPLV